MFGSCQASKNIQTLLNHNWFSKYWIFVSPWKALAVALCFEERFVWFSFCMTGVKDPVEFASSTKHCQHNTYEMFWYLKNAK